ncbi:MAG: DHH family phosphoesterase [Bacillota bacterium]
MAGQDFFYILLMILSIAGLLCWYLSKKTVPLKRRIKWGGGLDGLSAEILNYLPWGILILDIQGNILWRNKIIQRIMHKDKLFKGKVMRFLSETELSRSTGMPKGGKTFQLALGHKIYRVDCYQLKANTRWFFLVLKDVTEPVCLEQFHQDEKPAIGFIQIDNFSETVLEVDDEKRPVLLGEIDRILTEWVTKMEGYLRKFSEDKYLFLVNRGALRESQKNHFDIMDRVREISMGNKIPITLSIGIGTGEEMIIDLSKLAHLGLDLALGRGGDQVALKWPDKVLFYGGKSDAVEKKTKVKARVVAYTLKHYIEKASDVVVMGHESSDLDSAGSALGVALIALNLGKQVCLSLDNSTGALDKLYEIVEGYPKYADIFVNEKEVIHWMNSNTLLVICDTNKPSLLVEPAVLSKANTVILIDHHRRSEEFIHEAKLVYTEPYASSTSELVAEILQYLGEEITVDPLVASVLLAGITVDTKNFIFQTGVRTFEAASFLRRSGAETGLVRKLLRDDFDTVLERAQVVQNSQIMFNRIAVGVLDRIVPHNAIIAAQTADMLLTVENIIASFVLYAVSGGVNISGRSNGDLNVQVLLEQLGGGGHLSVAGAQLKGVTLDQAKEKLRSVIQVYLEENNLTIDN